MNDFEPIDRLASALLRGVEPGARRQLLRSAAQAVRKSQADRIARQQQPDGSAFAPRKAQTRATSRKGQLRRGMMFRKLRMARYLKAGAGSDEAWVGFDGRAGRIAQVHQEGLEDAPTRGARKVRYPRRVLLGLTAAEENMILDRLLEAVTPPNV